MSDTVKTALVSGFVSIMVAAIGVWGAIKPSSDRRKKARRGADQAAEDKLNAAQDKLDGEREAFRNEIRHELTTQIAQMRQEIAAGLAERDGLRARVKELEETVMRLQRQLDRREKA